MTATNKRYSYPRVTASRVQDHTPHVVHVGNLSLVPMRSKQALHPKEVLESKDRLARPSPWVASFFLPHNSLRVGERGFSQVVTQLHQLTRPITPACDRYVQYLLTGANPSVLNRHRHGLQSCRSRLSTYHSLTFPIDGLHFPPKGPVQSLVYPCSIN
jgi:hypothetical protein